MAMYTARMIGPTGVMQTLDFEALDRKDAEKLGGDGIDVLTGVWVEVKPKPVTKSPVQMQAPTPAASGSLGTYATAALAL